MCVRVLEWRLQVSLHDGFSYLSRGSRESRPRMSFFYTSRVSLRLFVVSYKLLFHVLVFTLTLLLRIHSRVLSRKMEFSFFFFIRIQYIT